MYHHCLRSLAFLLLAAPAASLPADESAPPDDVPAVMHFCWANCFTLQWNHGLYSRVDGSEETWTIERFSSQSVRLHRHDAPAQWNRFRADVAYEGQVSSGQLINVTVDGTPVPGIAAAWGAALESLPANNAERDRRKAALAAEVQTSEAPPPLQEEVQPPCPEDGYLWTPGYWAWGSPGYYWVAGGWVQPPGAGVLWTPGYWGFAGARYVFHPGYWGPHVGYYGGINYGFGYTGFGYAGGRWIGSSFAYNSAVNNVSLDRVHNSYRAPVDVAPSRNRVSYNGGPGGTTAAPSTQERAASTEARVAAIGVQHPFAPGTGGTAAAAAPTTHTPPVHTVHHALPAAPAPTAMTHAAHAVPIAATPAAPLPVTPSTPAVKPRPASPPQSLLEHPRH